MRTVALFREQSFSTFAGRSSVFIARSFPTAPFVGRSRSLVYEINAIANGLLPKMVRIASVLEQLIVLVVIFSGFGRPISSLPLRIHDFTQHNGSSSASAQESNSTSG
jgi:hypothetical protein